MVEQSQPQANPKVHPVDWLTLACVTIGAAAVFSDMLPPKFAAVLVALRVLTSTYTKWLGSQQQRDALAEGAAIGQELKEEAQVLTAPKAEPIDPIDHKTIGSD